MSDPGVSVVVAASEDAAGLEACLAALSEQLRPDVEVMVVSDVKRDEELGRRFPWASWRHAPAGTLVPHLWSEGMLHARRDVVALTISHCVPAVDWLSAIREAHSRLDAPAIGGRIEPPRGGSLLDWATWFLRYSAYLHMSDAQEAHDLAADNAAYRRDALDRHPEWQRDGFWEQDFHRRLEAERLPLWWVPQIRVTLRASPGLRRFLQQRFHHGLRFGRERVGRRGTRFRVVALAASPVIPALLFTKILARVVRSRSHLWVFAAAAPILACLVVAWSLGEAAGYAAGAPPLDRPGGANGDSAGRAATGRQPP